MASLPPALGADARAPEAVAARGGGANVAASSARAALSAASDAPPAGGEAGSHPGEAGSHPDEAASAADEVPWQYRSNVSSYPQPGMEAIVVAFAPGPAWRQRTLWVTRECKSDDLKYALRNWLEADVSSLRVHSAWRGTPYDRTTPVLSPPPDAAPDERPTFLVIARSCGP